MSGKVILILVLIGLVVGGTAWILLRPPVSTPSRLQGRDLTISGYRSSGALEWLIHAQTVTLENGTESLSGVTVSHYPEHTEPVVVSADHLVRGSGGSTLLGSIRLRQGEHLVMMSDSLYWDERNGVLETSSVSLELGEISVQAGGLHHDLRRGLAVLTRGVSAETVRDDITYYATASAAEAAFDRIAMHGDVVIETDRGDLFRSQRLETSPSSSQIALYGEVSGVWQSNEFRADSVSISSSGLEMRGRVTIDIAWAFEEEVSNDP